MGIIDDAESLVNHAILGVVGVVGGALGGLTYALKSGAADGGIDASNKTYTGAWGASNPIAAAALAQQGWKQVG